MPHRLMPIRPSWNNGGWRMAVRHLRGRDHRARRADPVPLGRDFQHHSRFAGSLLEGRREGGRPPKRFKCKEVGDFILSSLQGAILLSKGKRDTSPVTKFKRVL